MRKEVLVVIFLIVIVAITFYYIQENNGFPRGGSGFYCSSFSEFSGPLELVSLNNISDFNQVPSLNIPDDATLEHRNPHVVWMGFTNFTIDIFYRNRSNIGLWSEISLVSEEDNENSDLPAIVVDRESNFIIWRNEDKSFDYNSVGQIVHAIHFKNKSVQYWPSWENIPVEVIEPASIRNPSSDQEYFSAIAIGPNKTIHVVWHWLTQDGTTSIFYKNRSTEGIWSDAEVVSTESNPALFSRFPDIAVDSMGVISVVWQDDTTLSGSSLLEDDIFYKRKVPGEEWSEVPTEIASIENNFLAIHPSIAIDNNDNIHVAWSDFTNYSGNIQSDDRTDLDIVYRNRSQQGVWGDIEVVSTESNKISWDSDIVADSTGIIYIAWSDSSDYLSSGTDEDIFFKRNIGEGITWAQNPTKIVSIESNLSSRNPSFDIDENQIVHIVWGDLTPLLNSGPDEDIFYRCGNFSA